MCDDVFDGCVRVGEFEGGDAVEDRFPAGGLGGDAFNEAIVILLCGGRPRRTEGSEPVNRFCRTNRGIDG